MDQASHYETTASVRGNVAAKNGAERIVAHLVLANLSPCTLTGNIALRHISDAYEIVQGLSLQVQTLRTFNPMKMLQISVKSTSQTDKIVLPILNGTLVVPSFEPYESNCDLSVDLLQSSETEIFDLEIIYVHIRLRTSRTADALHGLLHADTVTRTDNVIDSILRENLRPITSDISPLDMADDYVSLALNLVRQRNVPLASLMLRKAETILDHYARSAAIEGHSRLVAGMKKQISLISKALNTTAS